MKGVIWILACVVLVGCESRRLDTRTVDSSRNGISRELAAAVKGALAAKSVEEGKLVQYGVEKQRLVSRLMPIDTEVDWAGVHPMAIEDYVTERDPEAAKNLCVVLELELMATEAVSDRKNPFLLYIEKRSKQKDRGEKRLGPKPQERARNPQKKHSRRQRAPQAEG